MILLLNVVNTLGGYLLNRFNAAGGGQGSRRGS